MKQSEITFAMPSKPRPSTPEINGFHPYVIVKFKVSTFYFL